jgi:hypothetical protein
MIVFPKNWKMEMGKSGSSVWNEVKQSKTDAYRFLKILMKTERKGNEKKSPFPFAIFPPFLGFLVLEGAQGKGREK